MRWRKIIAVAVAALIATMMCACNKVEHEHQYSDEWSYDDTYHWQEPICGDTTEPGHKSIHNFSSDGICHLCGYDPGAGKLPDSYTVTYGVSGEGGKVEGKLSQKVKRGGDAEPVTAVADEGFLFIMWSDGEIEAERQDKNVRQAIDVLAIFEPDPDDPNTDKDEDYGNDHEKEADTPNKGSTEEANGLEFTEMRDLTTDEVTGYIVRRAKTGNFDGNIPAEYKGHPVLEIDDEGFAGCSLQTITIPNTVTRIGHKGFYGAGLRSIEIPDSVIDVGNQSFQNCSSLQTVKLSNQLKGVWYKMFYRCSSLTEIDLPDSVEQIGRYAFYGCTSLKKVTYGKGMKESGAKAFGQCSNLQEVHTRDLKAWCETTFDYFMQALKSTFESQPLYYAHNLYFDDENGSTLVEDLVVPEGTKQISQYAFLGCTPLKSVKTPESVKLIDKMCFMDCANLEKVDFGEGLVSMKYSVFQRCRKLKYIKFPDSLTSIGIDPDAIENPGSPIFSWCDELTEITLGSGIEVIDILCSACEKLKDIYFTGTSEQWESIDKKPYWISTCASPLTLHCLGDHVDITFNEKWIVENSTNYPRYFPAEEKTTCNHTQQVTWDMINL